MKTKRRKRRGPIGAKCSARLRRRVNDLLDRFGPAVLAYDWARKFKGTRSLLELSEAVAEQMTVRAELMRLVGELEAKRARKR